MGKPSRSDREKPFGKRDSSKSSVKKKMSTEDCALCIGSEQASDHEVSQELVLSCIKKSRERRSGASESLRTLSEIDTEKWKPALKVSAKTDELEKKTEEWQRNLE